MSGVVLPGIREMFPEYLAQDHSRSTKKNRQKSLRSSTSRLSNAPHNNPPTLQTSIIPPSFPVQSAAHSSSDSHSTRKRSTSDSVFYSFDILRSDPSSRSLQHIASSATYPNRSLHPGTNLTSHTHPSDGSTPAFRVAVTATPDAGRRFTDPHEPRNYTSSSSTNHAESVRIDSGSGSGCSSFPVFGSAAGRRIIHSADISDSDDDELSPSNSGKRHVCPTCFKRFNRPSSLKIHVNTHTGATPFRCPWPECGREFNVNSNMRRHYRNHTIPGSKTVDHRRRRRRVIPAHGLMDGTNLNASYTIRRTPISSADSPLISSGSASEESDEDIPTPMDECDRLRSAVELEGASKFSKAQYTRTSRYYSQSHIRTLRFESPGSCSASPSLSPSPPPDHVYTPSAPYVRSVMDMSVSTALRPAFHPAFPAPLAGRAIKEER